ncbi:MAG: alkaline phosphatase D family protein [Rubrivivax sp.]|nr:alkaline phosphatase D family protein [Rubrivivax sp.]
MPDLRRRRSLGRLLALGAAPALASACAPVAFVRDARVADTPRFALGVASGSPAADSVVLWTRLAGDALAAEVPVAWEVAADEGFGRIVARGSEPARANDAHSIHLQVRGLEPARWYWYRFAALGQRSPVGRTRTAPAAEGASAAVARLDFAIASCQRWDHGYWAAWRDAAAHPSGRPLDLVLFLGDYIYEYGSPPGAVRAHEGGAVSTLEGYRARYAQYKSDPLLQAAHAVCPWIVIWDDHEVENDYAALQGEHLQPGFAARRAAAYRAWWEHMPLPPALRPVEAGGGAMTIHGRLDWGRLARLHWIDTRQFRDPQLCPRPGRGGSNTVRLRDCPALITEPARTLLGAAQERWLAEGWSLTQPWNLLAQQTLMARFTREAVGSRPDPREPAAMQGRYWTDGWDGYPGARQRLLSVLAERKVPGAVVLGGDVHANYVADLRLDPDETDPTRSPLVATEFCGTSISSRGSAQSAVDAALRFNPHIRHGRSEERGYVRFALTRERLEADLRVVADPKDANSTVTSAARFVVEAGKPGAERA